jgi:hypothetical protein
MLILKVGAMIDEKMMQVAVILLVGFGLSICVILWLAITYSFVPVIKDLFLQIVRRISFLK